MIEAPEKTAALIRALVRDATGKTAQQAQQD